MILQKIAVDVMGGDFGPSTTLPGVRLFLDSYSDIHVALFGPISILEPWIDCLPPLMKKRVSLHHAPDLLDPQYSSREAVRKKNSSLRLALDALKEHRVAAVVSGAQTGPLMALSKVVLGTLQGISRPAIGKALPVFGSQSHQKSVMLDLGANLETSCHQLVEFAFLGSALFRSLYPHKDQPVVKLMNIGTEEKKGHLFIQEAAYYLGRSSLNYQGFIEPDRLFTGDADVIVSDGFSGNIALKTAEGLAKILKKSLDGSDKRSWLEYPLRLLLKKALGPTLMKADPAHQNGGFILGLNGIVIKSHGGAQAMAFSKALEFAYQQIKGEVLKKVRNLLTENAAQHQDHPLGCEAIH